MNSNRSAHEISGLQNCLIDGFKHRMDDSVDPTQRIYFLTHYHSDHYGGLSSGWRWGTIYCSDTTANLICNIMKVKEGWVKRVKVGETITIPGATVTFLDANHCPGAVLLLFYVFKSRLYHLHTGDMRYCPAMKLYPSLQSVKIDRLYLDTTYAHPKHTFLPQEASIKKIVDMAVNFLSSQYTVPCTLPLATSSDQLLSSSASQAEEIHQQSFSVPSASSYDSTSGQIVGSTTSYAGMPNSANTSCNTSTRTTTTTTTTPAPSSSSGNGSNCGIVYISAYNLGKERVIFALADALPTHKVYMDADKMKIMLQIEGGRERIEKGRFTTNPHEASIHVCGMGFLGSLMPFFKPNFENIRSQVIELNAHSPEAHSIAAHVHDLRDDKIARTKPKQYTRALAFIPTGWAASGNYNKAHDTQQETKDGVEVIVTIVPYSEHSNYNELVEFVKFLKPREVVPTVYNDEKNRLYILNLFRNLVDRNSNLKLFISRMKAPSNLKSSAANNTAVDVISIEDSHMDTTFMSSTTTTDTTGTTTTVAAASTADAVIVVDLCDEEAEAVEVKVDDGPRDNNCGIYANDTTSPYNNEYNYNDNYSTRMSSNIKNKNSERARMDIVTTSAKNKTVPVPASSAKKQTTITNIFKKAKTSHTNDCARTNAGVVCSSSTSTTTCSLSHMSNAHVATAADPDCGWQCQVCTYIHLQVPAVPDSSCSPRSPTGTTRCAMCSSPRNTILTLPTGTCSTGTKS